MVVCAGTWADRLARGFGTSAAPKPMQPSMSVPQTMPPRQVLHTDVYTDETIAHVRKQNVTGQTCRSTDRRGRRHMFSKPTQIIHAGACRGGIIVPTHPVVRQMFKDL